MARRVTFSGDHQSLLDIALHHSDLENALSAYLSPMTEKSGARFVGYRSEELRRELLARRAEIDLSSSLNVLAAIEAAFRIDYLRRCQEKRKDGISRSLRKIRGTKGSRASLEDDILLVWSAQSDGSKTIVSALRGALKFRHWLAHGRYWTPRLGRKYDFHSIYLIAEGSPEAI